MTKLKYINLGCGSRFHPDWVNVNFVKSGEGVIPHNLLKGIPFDDNFFDVVYHSHVLEHFSKSDGEKFISECYRVLKPNGIIRVAVPDLEKIVDEYKKQLTLALEGDKIAEKNYEWIMLELYDQVVRNKSGGEMVKYLSQEIILNEDYIYQRIGEEGRAIRESILKQKKRNSHNPNFKQKGLFTLHKVFSSLKGVLSNLVKNTICNQNQVYCQIGQFRLSGEVHQWMYDRFSLKKLLENNGFKNIEIKDAFSSNIPNWNSYQLESKNGIVFKPDSLFMEATK